MVLCNSSRPGHLTRGDKRIHDSQPCRQNSRHHSRWGTTSLNFTKTMTNSWNLDETRGRTLSTWGSIKGNTLWILNLKERQTCIKFYFIIVAGKKGFIKVRTWSSYPERQAINFEAERSPHTRSFWSIYLSALWPTAIFRSSSAFCWQNLRSFALIFNYFRHPAERKIFTFWFFVWTV
jgi:hypothetical protein